MLLTNEQKQIFIKYLQVQINSGEGIKSQLSKLGLPSLVVDSLIKNEEKKINAFKVVFDYLSSGEEQNVTN